MPRTSLVQPVENLSSLAQAKVLALLEHLGPSLADWRQGEDLRQERTTVTLEVQTLAPQEEQLQQRLALVGQQIDAAMVAMTKHQAMAIGLVVVAVALAYFSKYALLLSLAAIWPGLQLRKGKKALAERIQERTQIEGELAGVSTRLQAGKERLLRIEGEFASRPDGFPQIELSEVQFNLQLRNLAGSHVLIDESGAHDQALLKTLDVSDLVDGVAGIERKMQQLGTIPPLLSPGEASAIEDPLNQLYGEEQALQTLVGEFTGNLGQLRDVSLSLPLIPSSSLLSQRLQVGQVADTQLQQPVKIATAIDEQAVQTFTDALDEHRQRGVALVENLRQLYEQLESTCNRFASARMHSVNTIHDSLAQVLNRASWCNRKFFCPRTILAPQYIQDLLGIDIAQAHLLDINDLFDRLQSDDVVRMRIAKKPELIEQLTALHQSIADFTQMNEAYDGNGSTLQSLGNKHAQQQLQEYAKQFRAVLNKILTGASYPVLNFSAEAQLYYDPENDEWSSDLNPYVYRTPDVLKYGSVIKTHHDLMIPLWEHLWTEKADFRKSELFRTNESMIRMSEKESEKLIEIGNQFRGDMRANRENLYLIESDLKSKHSEILSFRDGLHTLGLLGERSMQQLSDERLASLVVNESPLNVSHRYESTLAALPQAQAEVRGTAADPIDMVKDPAVLLSYESNGAPRLMAR
ncbi:MAG: hypothetical protein WCK08_12070 [Betaproteobacteria bacterium]